MVVCIPETQEILELFDTILDGKNLLRPADSPWNLRLVPEGTHVTYLCNVEGDKLGAVVTDINATVYLGGKLVMISETGLAGKARRMEVDETLADAVMEVVNMARTVFNQLVGNEHLRPAPTRVLERPRADGREVWLLDPSARLDLTGECSFGTLNISFLFR